jgi:hypothetical protein
MVPAVTITVFITILEQNSKYEQSKIREPSAVSTKKINLKHVVDKDSKYFMKIKTPTKHHCYIHHRQLHIFVCKY